jgi:hypothetical protein
MGAHPVWIILGFVIGGALALAGLIRPFLGVLILIAIHFIQPGEFIPALNAISLERTYGIALDRKSVV